MDLPKLENAPASLGQPLDQLLHLRQLPPGRGDALWRGFVGIDGQRIDFRNGFDPDDARTPDLLGQQHAHGLEEVAVRPGYMLDGLKGRQSAVGFLYQVIDVVLGDQGPAEPGAHAGLVGHDVRAHPSHDPAALVVHRLSCLTTRWRPLEMKMDEARSSFA
jgi:hypothetical protein